MKSRLYRATEELQRDFDASKPNIKKSSIAFPAKVTSALRLVVRLNREKAPEGLQCSGGFNAQGVVPLSEPSGQKHHTSGNKRKITHRYDRHLAESLAGEVFEPRGISERVLPFALELLPLILQLRGYTTSTHTHTMLNTAITT